MSKDESDCLICLEDFTSSPDNPAVALACGHLFHNSCVQTWLKTNSKTVCPSCKDNYIQPIIALDFNWGLVNHAKINRDKIELLKQASETKDKEMANLKVTLEQQTKTYANHSEFLKSCNSELEQLTSSIDAFLTKSNKEKKEIAQVERLDRILVNNNGTSTAPTSSESCDILDFFYLNDDEMESVLILLKERLRIEQELGVAEINLAKQRLIAVDMELSSKVNRVRILEKKLRKIWKSFKERKEEEAMEKPSGIFNFKKKKSQSSVMLELSSENLAISDRENDLLEMNLSGLLESLDEKLRMMKQDFLQEIKKIRDHNERAMLKHLSDFQDLLYDPLEKYSKVEAEKTELESEFDQLRSTHQTKMEQARENGEHIIQEKKAETSALDAELAALWPELEELREEVEARRLQALSAMQSYG